MASAGGASGASDEEDDFVQRFAAAAEQLRHSGPSADAAAAACATLNELFEEGQVDLTDNEETNGSLAELVLQVMHTHVACASVQAKALALLSKLSSSDAGWPAPAVWTEAVFAAARAHPGCVEVQQQAIHLLSCQLDDFDFRACVHCKPTHY
jgi:hypothetical protein